MSRWERLRRELVDWCLQRPLRQGKGTRENPLTIEDITPVMRELRRRSRIEVLDGVRLPDGREGTVVEEFNGTHALVEITDGNGRGIDFPEIPLADLALIWKRPR